MRLEQRSELLHPIQNGEDRPTQQHQVARDRRADWIVGGDIDRSAIQRNLQMGGVTVPADNLARETGRRAEASPAEAPMRPVPTIVMRWMVIESTVDKRII